LTYLPFSRNYNFVGRTDEIDALERKLFSKQDCQKVAVVGLGGVGKTQVALQFAYTVLENHLDVSVFWMHALSSETYEQSCRGVASVLGMKGDKEDVRELVQRHLDSERTGKWMLIVDNADHIEVLEGSNGEKGLLDYLPRSDSGLTVFTTRDKTTAHAIAGNSILDVEKLDLATASALFKKMLTRKDLSCDEAVIDELLQELDCLPLATTQAAAYVNCNAISVEEYLNLLRSTEQDLIFIMNEEMRDSTRYKHAANAVARTWLVSFEQIVRQDAHAANLLQYMSCIDWKAIPRSILPAIEPAARMTSAIGTLWSYSFINKRSDGKTYDMHRLVHVAARVWVKQKGLVVETQRKALEHLSRAFPWDKWDNREIWREYIPHAARMRDAKDGGHADARWMLCFKAGRCLRLDGRIRDAVRWLEESLDLRAHLPEDDENRLSTQHALATAYEANGQVRDAIKLLEHVVAIRQVLSEDDPNLRASQHVLAMAYGANGQLKDAIKLLEHTVAIERVLADDHPDRLASQHALARAYNANGQARDAVQLLGHVVSILQKVLAEDHPNRLASQHELASAYQANGQVRDAVQLLEHVVAIKRVLADDHPDRLASQHALARAYHANGQVKAAVQLLEHVVAMKRVVLAEDNSNRLASQHELARAYLDSGQVKEAAQLLEHVVKIWQRVLAEDHPDRLVSQYGLAFAYLEDGRVVDAVLLLEKVVAIQERVLAEDHPHRLLSERLLARAFARTYDELYVRSPSQADEQEPGRSSSRRSTAESEETLPLRSTTPEHPPVRSLRKIKARVWAQEAN
jgi:tetratricopeptide (TPR) repeat protein